MAYNRLVIRLHLQGMDNNLYFYSIVNIQIKLENCHKVEHQAQTTHFYKGTELERFRGGMLHGSNN